MLISLLITALSANAQTYCPGEEFTLHAEDYITGELQWQYSYDGEIWEDYTGANGLSLFLILEEDIYLRLQITDDECLPAYYTEEQHIVFNPAPDESNAGEDQLEIEGTSTTLNANDPIEGTGIWTISSGEGGAITDINSYNSEFTGTEGTTYILRWLIYNDCGYTEDFVTISFANPVFPCGEALVDTRDGQSYPTVEIDGKCWMAANLNIGTQLTGTDTPSDNETIEKYCYDDDPANCTTYGALYQWNEAMEYSTEESSQGICPIGWNIPSDEEVKELEMSLGMTQIDADIENNWRGVAEEVGLQMREGGSSGFNVQMSGVRTSGGSFLYFEGTAVEFGYIWTTTEATNYPSETYAYRRCWRTSNNGVGRYDTFNKQYSYSIRCVKDDN